MMVFIILKLLTLEKVHIAPMISQHNLHHPSTISVNKQVRALEIVKRFYKDSSIN